MSEFVAGHVTKLWFLKLWITSFWTQILHLQREARYRFHRNKIFDIFLTLFWLGAEFDRPFKITARERNKQPENKFERN